MTDPLNAWAGRRIRGGCPDCHAYLILTIPAENHFVVNIFHDHTCPDLLRRERAQENQR